MNTLESFAPLREGQEYTLTGAEYGKMVVTHYDGYRSNMDTFGVVEIPVRNTFPPQRVVARRATARHLGEEDDVLELVNPRTGAVVIRVGTGDIDDYYPYFVYEFDPMALDANAGHDAP